MKIGALIVAAGMSTRMGDFKPMMSIGSISVAQRIIATLHQAGVSKIVMVTGYNATTLERHLAGNGVIFLRNDQYETTQMFDSAKIGLTYLAGKCDKVLFTPVDVPLFTASTVKALLDSGARLACPMCRGQQGHPILIADELIPEILADSGVQGLKGAMDRCSAPLIRIEVDDPGTIRDADTPEDFSALVDYHNSQLIRPEISVALAKEKPFFDSQIAMLLMLIDETKSVRAAGQRMQLSYSSCWNMIRNLESQLSYPLIERSQGGAKGSTSILTERGKRLLSQFRAYEKRLRETANDLYGEYFAGDFGMKRVYLIRHGLPDFPGGKRMCLGHTDLPLSDDGYAQAQAAARGLPPVTAVFSSPLQRAVQTALAFGEPIVLEGLQEFSYGDWDGLCYDEIKVRYPELYAARGKDLSLPMPNSEPSEAGLARFRAAMERAAQIADGDFAVVAHGGIIQVFLESLGLKGKKPGYCEIIPLHYENGAFAL